MQYHASLLSDPFATATEWLEKGRLYVLGGLQDSYDPVSFEPLVAVTAAPRAAFAVMCTPDHLRSPEFGDWMARLGRGPSNSRTTSASDPGSLLALLLVVKLRRPSVVGLLVNPPGAVETMIIGGKPRRDELAYYFPSAQQLVAALAEGGFPADRLTELVVTVKSLEG